MHFQRGGILNPEAESNTGDDSVASNLVSGVSAAETWTESFVQRCRRQFGDHFCDTLNYFSLPNGFTLSVVVPVYNEASTVRMVIDRLVATGLPLQIVLVDDGSSDDSAQQLHQIAASLSAEGDQSAACAARVVVLEHPVNRGKGAAIRTGVAATDGDVVVIQDADLEYDPQDFRRLLRPIVQDEVDVVYGTRYGSADRLVSPWWHQMVNRFLSNLSGMLIGPRLTDVETCYKMARGDVFRRTAAACGENRFGIEIELTARFSRARLRFAEKPIRYRHRWYGEGKKIGWRDGVSAIRCIIWYGLFTRSV
ncbi:glycosyltransferase family 2 protein [Crateriforma spongiae]|uniref:glycosyltransferase family 2 protein n=1 Tax=Crateriforma spongiae TaxID=2724528 RepID=UPI00144598A2|nr:glycosyltransferase family 2 protein [Crateriforma spongiae]